MGESLGGVTATSDQAKLRAVQAPVNGPLEPMACDLTPGDATAAGLRTRRMAAPLEYSAS